MDCNFTTIKTCELKDSTFRSRILDFGDFDISDYTFSVVYKTGFDQIISEQEITAVGNILTVPLEAIEGTSNRAKAEVWMLRDGGFKDKVIVFDVVISATGCPSDASITEGVSVMFGGMKVPVVITHAVYMNVTDEQLAVIAQPALDAAVIATTAATNADTAAGLATDATVEAVNATGQAIAATAQAENAAENADESAVEALAARDAANAAAENAAMGWTIQTVYEADGARLIKKITGYTGGTGTLPTILSDNIGKYFKSDGTVTTVKADAADFKGPSGGLNELVKPEQTTFFDVIPGKNLFDKSKVQAGYYNIDNGYSFLPDAGLHSSPEFIKVDPNTKYSSTNPYAYILFYRADKSYPPAQPASGRFIATGAGATTFTTPSDIEYVRILLNPVHVNTMQFEKGLPTPYEPFGGTTTLKPEYIPSVEMGTHYIQVVKDGTGDFTTIKAAGLASSPKDLIVVHEGEYEEVCNFGAKEVHIMALCKETTILWNDSGKYADTPLYMGKGSVKNLQIKSIRNPLKDYSAIGATGYAVHYDEYNANARMLFENVDAISDFNSAFGCGLKANSHLIIRNCRGIATGLHGETGGVAGFACHGGPAGITARIVLDKSEFRGPLMDVYLSYSAVAQTINLEAYYNIAKTILINSPEIWVKNAYNFGNQATALNTL